MRTPLLAAAALLAASAAAGEPAGLSLPAEFRAFADTSPWNTPIAADATPQPASPQMIARLKQAAGRLKADHAAWSVPLFVVSADVPPQTVWFAKEANPLLDPADSGRVDGIPLPDNAWPDPRADGHLVLVDPRRMVSWDFSRLRRDGSRWVASRIDRWDLRGSGVRPPFDGRRWWTHGAVASGAPLLAGLVRPEEVRAGEIRHALLAAAPTTRRAAFPGGPLELCPPASRSDGRHDGPDTLPMGVRLQLDPAFDPASLGLSREAAVIARAMQRYGVIVGVSSHDVFKLFLQNLGPDGGAWGDMDLSGLARIPIERFRVLDCPLATRMTGGGP